MNISSVNAHDDAGNPQFVDPMIRRINPLFAITGIALIFCVPATAQTFPLKDQNICKKESSCDSGITASRRFFWVPPASCPSVNPYTRPTLIPANGSHNSQPRVPNKFTLFNRYSPRVLQANGTLYKDVFVGTENVRDILDGSSGGGDTFIVGSGTSAISFDFATGDRYSWETPPAGESDDVYLTAGVSNQPEYIYIYTPLERSGGRVGLAPRRTGTGTYDNPYPLETIVYGAQEIPPGLLGGGFCDPVASLTSITSSLIAMVNPGFGSLLKIAPFVSYPSIHLVPSRAKAHPQADLTSGGSDFPPYKKPSEAPPLTLLHNMPGIPGIPRILNLSTEEGSSDLLILPTELFNNSVLGVGELKDSRSDRGRYMRPTYPISVLGDFRMVASAKSGFARTDKSHMQRYSQSAASLEKIRTDRYPLFYFSDSGLLVFSSNDRPLGSKENPGRVIAQLLDGKGQPLVLPVKGPEPVFNAEFLAFKPLEPVIKAVQTPPPPLACSPSKTGPCLR
jgi:hypothetical protein